MVSYRLSSERRKVDIIMAGNYNVATRRYAVMVQKAANVSSGSQSKTRKITSVMIKIILMKKISAFFLKIETRILEF